MAEIRVKLEEQCQQEPHTLGQGMTVYAMPFCAVFANARVLRMNVCTRYVQGTMGMMDKFAKKIKVRMQWVVLFKQGLFLRDPKSDIRDKMFRMPYLIVIAIDFHAFLMNQT